MQKNTINLIFGLKVRLLRQQQFLTYQQLSDKTGMAVSFLHDIEKGKKYPSGDKILALAQALGVTYDTLVSLHGNSDIQPIVELLESDFLATYPIDLFGLDTHAVVELLSSRPEKTNHLIHTLQALAIRGNITNTLIFNLALNAYRKNTNNYFPEIEAQVRKLRTEQDLNSTGSASIPSHILERLLHRLFGISIDREKLPAKFSLRNTRAYYSDSHKTLFLNKELTSAQESYYIAKEIGYHYLGITRRSFESSPLEISSFDQLRNNFEASYFSTALLLDENSLAEDMRACAGNVQWVSAEWLSLLTKYRATPDMLLNRMASLFSKHFGIKELFVVRMEGNDSLNRFEKTDEFHLCDTQNPYSIANSEHYCRRWPGIDILRVLKASNPVAYTHTVASAHIHQSLSDRQAYLCISMAKPLRGNINAGASTTLGFVINESVQRLFRFADNPKMQGKPIHYACQSCPLSDCDDRAATGTEAARMAQLEKTQSALRELDA